MESHHAVHLAVSNQSRSDPRVALRVTVDNESVFNATLESKELHTWHELNLSLRSGSHVVEVQEAQSGAKRQLTIDVNKESWVTVMFTSPPPSLSVTSQDSPVNFM